MTKDAKECKGDHVLGVGIFGGLMVIFGRRNPW